MTATNTDSSTVTVYSRGLVMCSVCAPREMSAVAVEAAVNRQEPTGISSAWEVSTEPFAGTRDIGPITCSTDPERRHWLLSC